MTNEQNDKTKPRRKTRLTRDDNTPAATELRRELAQQQRAADEASACSEFHPLSAFGRRSALALLAVVPFAVGTLVWLAGPQVFAWRNLIVVGPFAAIAVAAAVARERRGGSGRRRAVAVAALATPRLAGPSCPPARHHDVADALVKAGWQRDDAIVAFGDFFDLRGPLAWAPARSTAADFGGVHRRVVQADFLHLPT